MNLNDFEKRLEEAIFIIMEENSKKYLSFLELEELEILFLCNRNSFLEIAPKILYEINNKKEKYLNGEIIKSKIKDYQKTLTKEQKSLKGEEKLKEALYILELEGKQKQDKIIQQQIEDTLAKFCRRRKNSF